MSVLDWIILSILVLIPSAVYLIVKIRQEKKGQKEPKQKDVDFKD